jgi:hypothetical protein
MVFAHLVEADLLFFALFFNKGAPSLKFTPGRRICGRRDIAFQRFEFHPLTRFGDRNCGKKGPGIGMKRVFKERFRGRVFHNMAQVHDGHMVA